jgi:integrase
MASIRKRGYSWEAQVRRQGYPSLCKSFSTKADAAQWAREQERAIERAELPTTIRDFRNMTVSDLLRRYGQEITPIKRGAKFEESRIRQLLSHPTAATRLHQLSGAVVTRYRDDRLKVVKPASVRRELTILRHVFEIAKREWGIPLSNNPVHQIKLPDDGVPRSRRLAPGDADQLFDAISPRTGWYLRPLIVLATETGMRRGELLSIRWIDVDLSNRTIRILKTKNGHPRTVPLSPIAIQALSNMEKTEGKVFPISTNAVRLAWERLRKKAGLEDLRLHDLRHEAVSRFFEAGLNVPEVALISGHRDPRMLFRYTHPKPELVAEKLAAAERKQNVGVVPRSVSGTD